MTAVGPTVFAAIVWGSLALVGVVFGYELYTVYREFRDGSENEGAA